MALLTTMTEVPDALRDLIGDGLDAYNLEKAGPPDERMLWIVARDDDGAGAGRQLDGRLLREAIAVLGQGTRLGGQLGNARQRLCLAWHQGHVQFHVEMHGPAVRQHARLGRLGRPGVGVRGRRDACGVAHEAGEDADLVGGLVGPESDQSGGAVCGDDQ